MLRHRNQYKPIWWKWEIFIFINFGEEKYFPLRMIFYLHEVVVYKVLIYNSWQLNAQLSFFSQETPLSSLKAEDTQELNLTAFNREKDFSFVLNSQCTSSAHNEREDLTDKYKAIKLENYKNLGFFVKVNQTLYFYIFFTFPL